MTEDKRDGFQRWAEYMQFKSLAEACFRFELPITIISTSVMFGFSALVILSKRLVLTTVILSTFLWAVCFLLAKLGFIGQREKYLKQFGKAAYRVAALRFLLPYAAFWWSAASMPLWVPGERILSIIPFSILGAFMLAVLLFLTLKIQAVFGMDRLSFAYSYFPQEARLVKSQIFEFLRHPVYAGWIYFGIGFFLIRGTFTSLASLTVNIIAISLLAGQEEKDITKYFKDDYVAYKKLVPRFIPKRPVAFLKFLFK
ncbi:MAG: isoprenylcysteine carboxylmethyltransferase family protein [Candidatus Omnitrophica bacterium]|nr:isoprenylcysteine carboxylmethyltransferase family protein [Candidatus Omnitrophota bacterium]MDD5236386.1 isoprenylcysteine carboxylmethyltransferase family protein [Candidatus Omnitrophota bacterium]MDD5610678.1 isoprenylcysteine carboxylmethyltransferase family protein [Candidatus Omnitrophota bacterium]